MAPGRVLNRSRHMRDAAAAIERVIAGKTFAEYGSDPDLAAAVERYLERLSEASRHVPDDVERAHLGVDWRGVADLGNVLRHAYDQVIDHRIWQLIEVDLAPLRLAVDAMIAEVDRSPGARRR